MRAVILLTWQTAWYRYSCREARHVHRVDKVVAFAVEFVAPLQLCFHDKVGQIIRLHLDLDFSIIREFNFVEESRVGWFSTVSDKWLSDWLLIDFEIGHNSVYSIARAAVVNSELESEDAGPFNTERNDQVEFITTSGEIKLPRYHDEIVLDQGGSICLIKWNLESSNVFHKIADFGLVVKHVFR